MSERKKEGRKGGGDVGEGWGGGAVTTTTTKIHPGRGSEAGGVGRCGGKSFFFFFFFGEILRFSSVNMHAAVRSQASDLLRRPPEASVVPFTRQSLVRVFVLVPVWLLRLFAEEETLAFARLLAHGPRRSVRAP